MWLLVGWFLPLFWDECCGGPLFPCCGWWVGCACDRWWLFSLLWKLCLHMCIDLLYCLSGLCLYCGVSKLNCWNLVFSTSGELASFVEFDAWFDLPWFEGELVIRLGFMGSMICCHWETMCFVAALQSFELAVCHPYDLIWGGAHVLSYILYILLFHCIFFILN
jgi:hypothetical protein